MTSEVIRLRLPARPQYGRLARIAAAQIAVRRGFTLREIDDLRLAIDEAVILVLGPAPEPGNLEVEYTLTKADLAVTLSISDETAKIPTERIERFTELASDLVSSFAIDPDHGVRIVKMSSRPS